jgi:hypothetical protein
VIKPRVGLDDEQTRLLTYEMAHTASVEHLDAVALASADIAANVAGSNLTGSSVTGSNVTGSEVSSDVDPVHQFGDESADEMTYRAALAALSGVVQRSLRDFLS